MSLWRQLYDVKCPNIGLKKQNCRERERFYALLWCELPCWSYLFELKFIKYALKIWIVRKFQSKCIFITLFILLCFFSSFLTGKGCLLPFSIQLVLPMEKGQHWGLSYLILSWSVWGIDNVLLITVWAVPNVSNFF